MEATALRTFTPQRERKSRFIIDLSEASLIGVLQAYQDHKRKTSPGFTIEAVISNLKRVQDQCLLVLQPDDVTDEFYSYFIQYGTRQNLAMSSIKCYCCSIRTALSWGTKHGCPVSSSYDELNIRDSEPHRVSLSADDVSHIAHYDCNTIKCRSDHRKTLERVRDSIVLQTNLFCRYSDLEKISRKNFTGHVFSYVQQKTGGKAVVDIDRYSVTPKLAMEILDRYGYTCPYKGGIDNFNRYLHELLGHIGGPFDEVVAFEEKINGVVVQKTYKRRELISSHCARRTAITIAVKTAQTETEVRRCSGHVSNGRDSFRKYIVYE